MAKGKAKTASAENPRTLGARMLWVCLVRVLPILLVSAALLGGYKLLRSTVERAYLFPKDPPKIVLLDRPAWMTDLLASQIERLARPAGISSPLDDSTLPGIADRLKQSAWVKQVRQVRRVYREAPGDTIEIDAVYRQPMAMVKGPFDYYLVDTDGVLLPDVISPEDVRRVMYTDDGKINIRCIQGVQSPRPDYGQVWKGEDIRAGLDLAKLLQGKAYTDEIERIDVENLHGRVTNQLPQIRLYTCYKKTPAPTDPKIDPHTEVRWGEPVDQDFHVEIRPEMKLERLADFKQRFGRVDAGYSWVSIHMPQPTHPPTEGPHANGR